MRENYNGFDDAIPVKRSKKSERVRREARAEAEKKRSEAELRLSRVPAMRQVPQNRSVPQTHRASGRRPIPQNTDKMRSAVNVATSGALQNERKAAPNTAQKTAPVSVYRNTVPQNRASATAKPTSQPLYSNVPIKKASAQTQNLRDMRDIFAENKALGDAFAIHRDGETKRPRENRLTVGRIVRRSLLCVFTALALAVASLFGVCYTVATGPSETVRNILVLSALQASATKWVPGLFLDDDVVSEILADSKKVNTDVISIEDYGNDTVSGDADDDKWVNAIDGMIYETVSGATFKGYVLLIRDPSRVSVGISVDEFNDSVEGKRIFELADKYGAVAAINGGEYPDNGGMGIGGRPIGITYSDGKCVWNDNLRRTFMGFDSDDRLVVREGITKAEADSLGIRDGVCFQTGNSLISNDGGNITMYYADNDTGTAQRTAIGQAADGTVIFLVTDGRTASSLGATHNDVIDVMVSYGAISAGMLDGGSSSLMYYRDYYTKYGIDQTSLDEYQKMGLVNKYKAFTTPRRIPTCFIVAPEQ